VPKASVHENRNSGSGKREIGAATSSGYAAPMPQVSAATVNTLVGVALWRFCGSLAVTDAATSRRIGLLAPLWLLALSTAASVALIWAIGSVGRAAPTHHDLS
jgi:hypothetical protein